MADKSISNPFSTGGGGNTFEVHVQAMFLILMLSGGFVPGIRAWPISRIMLQGRYQGYRTDDLIVFVNELGSKRQSKLLVQVKHTIAFTENDATLEKVLHAAWLDFLSPDHFDPDRDAIALITGPLNSDDIAHTRQLLEFARSANDASDFITKVTLARYSHQTKRKKLKAFRGQLKKAKGEDLTDEELWRFLKVFHILGCDLDFEASLTTSLLRTIIRSYKPENLGYAWERVVEHVMYSNQDSKLFDISSIPSDILELFQRDQKYVVIAPDYVSNRTASFDLANVTSMQSELVVALLLGEWNERFDADIRAIEDLACAPYPTWIAKIREVLQLENSPLTLHNLHWSTNNQGELWTSLTRCLFDDHLNRFRTVAISVLGERKPELELEPEVRYQAAIYGKVAQYSHHLRKGIASTLAILGNCEVSFSNCPTYEPRRTVHLTVRELLTATDWSVWASLDDILPLLAEAAPEVFLDKVEEALRLRPSPFHALFAQERASFVGQTYMSGLLWGLELLAWESELLPRVIIILGELASIDPGGKWGNRPDRSLTTILLPWLPQTLALPEERNVAVQALTNEFPEVAWRLLLTLLPGATGSSSGSYRPKWRRNVPSEAGKGTTRGEYSSQIATYSRMMVTLARLETDRLVSLSSKLDLLPLESQEELLQYMESQDVLSSSDELRTNLWNNLLDIISKHRRYPDAEWSLDIEQVNRIEEVAEKIAPERPDHRLARLFNKDGYELLDGDGEFSEQERRLAAEQRRAVEGILKLGGVDSILSLCNHVTHPETLGNALGGVDSIDTANKILPGLLLSDDISLQKFVQGYVFTKFRIQGWEWVAESDLSTWSAEQVGQFFAYLPFCTETWSALETLPIEARSYYWRRTGANPYDAKGDLTPAIEKLTSVGRAAASVRCLRAMLHLEQPINSKVALNALDELSGDTKGIERVDYHAVIDVIKSLQNDTLVDRLDLMQVEWKYLHLLDGWHDARPLTLEQRLAHEPEFFADAIRAVYRSKNETADNVKTTEVEKMQAEAVSRLLWHWEYPPGLQLDSSFDEKHFKSWLSRVRELCEESGHLDIALARIGHVLVYAPPEPTGLWLPHSVAEALNQPDSGPMRESFRIELFNSRGVHGYSGGHDESSLAELYDARAKAIGQYTRLAAELRKLAEEYRQEAKYGFLE